MMHLRNIYKIEARAEEKLDTAKVKNVATSKKSQ